MDKTKVSDLLRRIWSGKRKWWMAVFPLLALYLLDFQVAPRWVFPRLEGIDKQEISIVQGQEALVVEGISPTEGSPLLCCNSEGDLDLDLDFARAKLTKGSEAMFGLFVPGQKLPSEFGAIRYASYAGAPAGKPCRTSFSLSADEGRGRTLPTLRLSQPEPTSPEIFRFLRVQLAGSEFTVSLQTASGQDSGTPGLSCSKRLRIGKTNWDFYAPLSHEISVASGGELELRLQRLPQGTAQYAQLDDLLPINLLDGVTAKSVRIVDSANREKFSVAGRPGGVALRIKSLKLGTGQMVVEAEVPSLAKGFKDRKWFVGFFMALFLAMNMGLAVFAGSLALSAIKPPQSSRIGIFVSYKNEDKTCMLEILDFLQGLERDVDGVTFWVDKKISAGTDWDDEIRQQLKLADIGLILVSQKYLDSWYCRQETQILRKKARLVVPIILSKCDLVPHSRIVKLQFPHDQEETLDRDYLDTGRRNELFTKVRVTLREKAQELREEKESKWPLLHRILKRLRRQKK